MTERSLVTFALFAYNQEQYIREAVQGALDQTYSPLEIILSDDCSSDHTYEIMKDMASDYKGPHRVVLRRNNENLGVCAHVNAVFEESEGEVIVVAGGDDISFPFRVRKVIEVWGKTGASALYSAATIIDHDSCDIGIWGVPKDIAKVRIDDSYRKFEFYGAGAAYKKIIFKKFGRLPTDTINEDDNLAFRAALMGGVGYINESLLAYRQHDTNLWSKVGAPKALDERAMQKVARLKMRISNQKHIVEYIAEVCGSGAKAHLEYKAYMVTCFWHHNFYRRLIKNDLRPEAIEKPKFDVQDYVRAIVLEIQNWSGVLWRGCRRSIKKIF
jgi:glycosyltransferase involved in cell wall biosynthesis